MTDETKDTVQVKPDNPTSPAKESKDKHDEKHRRKWLDIYTFVAGVVFDVVKYYVKIIALIVYAVVIVLQTILLPSSICNSKTSRKAEHKSRQKSQTSNNQTMEIKTNKLDIYDEYNLDNASIDFVTENEEFITNEETVKHEKSIVNLQLSQTIPQEGLMVNFQVSKDGKIPSLRKMDNVPPMDAQLQNKKLKNTKVKYGDEESFASYDLLQKTVGGKDTPTQIYQPGGSNHITDGWNQNVRDLLKKKTNIYKSPSEEDYNLFDAMSDVKVKNNKGYPIKQQY